MNAQSSAEPSRKLYEGVSFKAENPDQNRLVLKNGSRFLVLDETGFVPSSSHATPFGLYCDDTRFLSKWELLIDGIKPRLLGSNVEDGFAADFVYGNATLPDVPEQSLMIRRLISIDGAYHESLTLTNYHTCSVEVELSIAFDADFADIFEVRGSQRVSRGAVDPTRVTTLKAKGKRVRIGYTGLDELKLMTTIDARGTSPVSVAKDGHLRVVIHLAAGKSETLQFFVGTTNGTKVPGGKPVNEATARKRTNRSFTSWKAGGTSIETDNDSFNRVLERSYRDLFVLRQPTPKGTGIAAGLPWFSCPFGRDQAITALATLQLMPSLSREVLTLLAAYQGEVDEFYREERPGKIMHELRIGEMARCNEIPFNPYFGSIDSTPLWLMLLASYVEWTDDLELARKLWKNAERALSFVDRNLGDRGYLWYGGSKDATIINQGWKDSYDSVMHADGSLAQGPIALCEPQGYLYAAWRGLSRVAARLGRDKLAARLESKAQALKKRFARDFWSRENDFVVLALDGDGNQCDVVSSNPGHLLSTGILTAERSARVAARLMEPDMFCGWGIRTLSQAERSYNPMSYHNGSVWPHDNAMIVSGMAKSGERHNAHRVLEGLFAVAQYQSDLRLPELFCGFATDPSEGPIRYPVSCVPQAWAASSMFQILFACLGLKPDHKHNRLSVEAPSLPSWLKRVTVRSLVVGTHSCDLEFRTSNGVTTCTVLKAGELDVRVKS